MQGSDAAAGFPFTLQEVWVPSAEEGTTKTQAIGDDDTNRYDKTTEDRMT